MNIHKATLLLTMIALSIASWFRGTTLYARYRLTNFFNPDYITPEVTRLSIGINFAL